MNRIVPAPTKIIKHQGRFRFDTEVAIVMDDAVAHIPMLPALEVRDERHPHPKSLHNHCTVGDSLDVWLRPLHQKTNTKFSIVKKIPSSGTIIIFEYTASEESESYSIDVEPQKILIRSSDGPGFFYALVSLEILIEDGEIPALSLSDQPQFPWRGMLLDCARFFQSVERIEETLTHLSRLKFNVLHLHLTEDQGWRPDIHRYPRLTRIGSQRLETQWGHHGIGKKRQYDGIPHGGFYTQEELRHIVRYGQERGIMIVPEIDMPGHAQAAIAAYPELGVGGVRRPVLTHWGINSNIFSPSETTLTFLKNVLDEIMEIFPSPWIHVGGDEAVKTQWKWNREIRAIMKQNGVTNAHELQGWFMNEIQNHLSQAGRTAVGWDENLRTSISSDMVIMAWRHANHGVKALEKGHQVLMSPMQSTYFDHGESTKSSEPLTIDQGFPGNQTISLKDVYDFNPIPKQVPQENQANILGGQMQLWTEYVPHADMADYLLWPRGVAMAEALWSAPENKDYATFQKGLEGILSCFDAKSVAYRFPGENLAGPSFEIPSGDTLVEPHFRLDSIAGSPRDYQRLQILFYRGSGRGAGMLHHIALLGPDDEVLDCREFTFQEAPFFGSFNRMNVVTLDAGDLVSLKGCCLKFRASAIHGDKAAHRRPPRGLTGSMILRYR